MTPKLGDAAVELVTPVHSEPMRPEPIRPRRARPPEWTPLEPESEEEPSLREYVAVIAGERKLEVGAARAALTQLGYLVGSLLGGVALAIGGRSAVGVAFGSLFLAAAAPYFRTWSARCEAR